MAKITLLLLCAVLTAQASTIENLDRFPKSTVTIESGTRRHAFEIWVADTPARLEQGLMFVRHLPNGKGMIFFFKPTRPVSMWMKNTLIPLDMLFIDAQGRVIHIAERAQPQSLETIGPRAPVAAVLEIAGGECARLGITTGARVRYEKLVAR